MDAMDDRSAVVVGRLLTVSQVAEMLAVSECTVYELARSGRLAHRRISRKSVRFAASDVTEYVEACRFGGASQARYSRGRQR